MDGSVLPFGAGHPFPILVYFGEVDALLRGKGFVVGLFKIRGSKGANVAPGAESLGLYRFLTGCKPVSQPGGKNLLLELRPGGNELFVGCIKLLLFLPCSGRVRIVGMILKSRLGKTGDQPVVVTDGNRVILVVVTSSTADGQTKHRGAHGVDDIIELLVATPLSLFLGLLGGEGTGSQEAGGGLGHIVFRFHLVTRNLQLHEAIVGHVLVQGLDDEIAEMIGVGTILVEGVAIALGKACEIQPMPCPAFTVMRSVEESIDECFIGLWGLIVEVGLNLRGLWRQTPQAKHGPAEQRLSGSFRVGAQRTLFEFGENEKIDGCMPPRLIFHFGRADRLQGPERPELASLRQIDSGGSICVLLSARDPHEG